LTTVTTMSSPITSFSPIFRLSTNTGGILLDERVWRGRSCWLYARSDQPGPSGLDRAYLKGNQHANRPGREVSSGSGQANVIFCPLSDRSCERQPAGKPTNHVGLLTRDGGSVTPFCYVCSMDSARKVIYSKGLRLRNSQVDASSPPSTTRTCYFT
jgi:hypothetical protein